MKKKGLILLLSSFLIFSSCNNKLQRAVDERMEKGAKNAEFFRSHTPYIEEIQIGDTKVYRTVLEGERKKDNYATFTKNGKYYLVDLDEANKFVVEEITGQRKFDEQKGKTSFIPKLYSFEEAYKLFD